MDKEILKREAKKVIEAAEQIIRYAENDKPDDREEQLDFLVRYVQYVIDDSQSYLFKRGKGKSYMMQVEHNVSILKSRLRDVELWRTEGLVPEYVEMKRNENGPTKSNQ